jgi:thioredoxin 1
MAATTMPTLTLNLDTRAAVAAALAGDGWVVACLCAAWCGTCGSYRATFEQFSSLHPELCFVWIDIEDQADALGDLDVENFPTLLMQKDGVVAFFGTMLPELALAERLLQAQMAIGDDELRRLAGTTEERRAWQQDCNLRVLLNA